MRGVSSEEWEKVRDGGRIRYAFLTGVVGRGVPIAVVLMVVFLALEGRSFSTELLQDPWVWGRFLLAAALFSVGGVISAFTRWRAMEQRYGMSRPESGAHGKRP